MNTCWELKEGTEPVDLEDPRFHENYLNVGNFPEAPFGWKKTQAVLMGVFGGFATSLL